MAEDVSLVHDDDPALQQLDTESNGAGSVLDALRARRAQAEVERYYDLAVPGYAGCLVLRLGPLPQQQLAKISSLAAQPNLAAERLLDLNLDTVIGACTAVLGRKDRADDFTVLVDERGDQVRVDRRLVDMLALDLPAPVRDSPRARDVLLALFDQANSPQLAITIASGEYMDWARSASGDIDEELLGES